MTVRLATPRHAISGVVVVAGSSATDSSTRHDPWKTSHAPGRRSLIERHCVRGSNADRERRSDRPAVREKAGPGLRFRVLQYAGAEHREAAFRRVADIRSDQRWT